MQKYIFLDLDDTLFQTLRKCPSEVGRDKLEARAYLSDGSENSFATPKQQWLWDWLNAGFKVVPVTGRDEQAFARVNLPFTEEVVLNHGAVVLDKQRQVDVEWMSQMMAALPPFQEKLMLLWQEVEEFVKLENGFKPRLVNDFDITWYGVVKHADGTEATLRRLLDQVIRNHPLVIDGSLYWHLNGNNLAVLPKILNKESAVSFLLKKYHQQYPEILTFAAGDSHSDAAFLALCDYAIVPKHTQLGKRLMDSA
jgi:hydroxymethylpyrimidine pyrophosphatase-like HAD family hydrolase